jgi:hypothetical protein
VLKQMKPTAKLRWREPKTDKEEQEFPCIENRSGWVTSLVILDQWWEDENGKGEWRPIPCEW